MSASPASISASSGMGARRSGHLVHLKRDVSLDVPLFWQHLRITARTLDELTKAVREETRNWLVRG